MLAFFDVDTCFNFIRIRYRHSGHTFLTFHGSLPLTCDTPALSVQGFFRFLEKISNNVFFIIYIAKIHMQRTMESLVFPHKVKNIRFPCRIFDLVRFRENP